MVQPMVADIDRIKNEVHRQTSLCQCSKKYDVQQIAEGRYRVNYLKKQKKICFQR